MVIKDDVGSISISLPLGEPASTRTAGGAAGTGGGGGGGGLGPSGNGGLEVTLVFGAGLTPWPPILLLELVADFWPDAEDVAGDVPEEAFELAPLFRFASLRCISSIILPPPPPPPPPPMGPFDEGAVEELESEPPAESDLKPAALFKAARFFIASAILSPAPAPPPPMGPVEEGAVEELESEPDFEPAVPFKAARFLSASAMLSPAPAPPPPLRPLPPLSVLFDVANEYMIIFFVRYLCTVFKSSQKKRSKGITQMHVHYNKQIMNGHYNKQICTRNYLTVYSNVVKLHLSEFLKK